MTVNESKNHLRDSSLSKRKELAEDKNFLDSSRKEIAKNLLSIPAMNNARIVASYAPSMGEPDPHGFLNLLKSSGLRQPQLVFPRVAGEGLLTLHFSSIEGLQPGSFGIREPHFEAFQPNLEDIDVILVPGVSFDLEGGRLGYGKGFYDRLLGSYKTRGDGDSKGAPDASISSRRPVLIGIGYEQTLFELLPTEDHDVMMDYLVTPKRVIKTA